jgi:hypothetical protein
MRGPALLVVLLLAAVAHFGFVGLPAHREAARALDDLRRREDRFAELQRRLPAVSWAEHEALVQAAAELAALDRERLATLLDTSLAQPLPDFETALAWAPLAPLDPLADALREAAARSLRAEQTLTALLHALAESGVGSLATLELEHDGEPRAVPAVDGLVAVDASLTVVAGLHEALTLLELLVPGSGEPLLTVRQASLQRVDASAWDAETSGPPVRLSVSVAAHFAERGTEAR